MAKRTRFELQIEVLTAIKNGEETPSKIIRAANISWTPLQQMLYLFTRQELVIREAYTGEDQRKRETLKLTEKGVNVLKYFNRAKSLTE